MARKTPIEQKEICDPTEEVANEVIVGKAVVVTSAKYDETLPGRDGTGPYLTTAEGVTLPDGSCVPAGGTFCAGTEGVTTAQLEGWQARGLVVANKVTKEFKGELTTKG